MDALRIEPEGPYSLQKTVGAFARFPEELVDIATGSQYRRVLAGTSCNTLFEARQLDNGDLSAPVQVELLASSHPVADDDSSLTEAFIRMIGARESIDPVVSLLSEHPTLRYLASHLAGLRRPLDASPFEGLVSSILAQLISIRGAAVVRARIVERFGTSLDFAERTYWAFPEPDAIRQSSMDELCSIGMTRVKAKAILAVAELSVKGELDLDQLDQHSDEEVVRHLVSLPGIGPWTAEWFLVNVMGRMSIVPAGDLGIRRSTGKWLLDGEMPSPDDVRRIYEPFGEHRAYVAYFVLSAERFNLELPEST